MGAFDNEGWLFTGPLARLAVDLRMLRFPEGLSARSLVAAVCLGCAALAGVHALAMRQPSSRQQYEAVAKGSFGAASGQADVEGERVAFWSSESTDGASAGSVSLGPFPAPDHLRYALRGHPGAPGNQLFLELELTGIRLPLAVGGAGEGWTVAETELPLGWRGWRVTLNAVSASGGPARGFAVTEPFGLTSGGVGRYGLWESVSAWLVNGTLYGVLFLCAALVLARKTALDPWWIALAAGAVVACGGYLAFWAYFLSPRVGVGFSCALFAAAVAAAVLRNSKLEARDREWALAGVLAALIGTTYLGVLHLYPSARDFYQLAANRFIPDYPGDNRLPFDFANLLYHGQRPRELGAGWLSSDRPPLQEGWLLVAWPLTAALGFPAQSASGSAAVWFQLLWVPAAYGLLRSQGLAARRAFAWTAVMALDGFFLLHSVYTWPKLAAAAFVCGAFGLWILRPVSPGPAQAAAGGLLAALGWLSHGGIAFSLIPIAPWVAWRCWKGEWARWIAAAAVFLSVVLPWVVYQKAFAPPGDRLLKWHLAGQAEVDPRPLGTLLSEAYGRLTWPQILSRKAGNAAFQFVGDWSGALGWSAQGVAARRTFEVDHLARTIGVWALALPLMAAAVALRLRITPRPGRGDAALMLWIGFSCLAWWLLLFDVAIVPQGSFAVVIALLVLGSVWFERTGRGAILAVAALQAYGLGVTWIPGSAAVGGHASVAAAALVLAGAATLLALAISPGVPASSGR